MIFLVAVWLARIVRSKMHDLFDDFGSPLGDNPKDKDIWCHRQDSNLCDVE